MNVRRAILAFVPIAIAVTATYGLVYLVAQQGLRSGGNDPQRQVAEDVASQLDRGMAPADVVGDGPIDVARSLAPFVVVYAADGSVVATDGQLDGASPLIPKGVLDAARAKGSNAVTWQPRPGVRIATVTIPWRDGTVMAGRSLRIVEEREAAVRLLVGLAWVVTLLAVAAACLIVTAVREPPVPAG
jgi:hypothetical protein